MVAIALSVAAVSLRTLRRSVTAADLPLEAVELLGDLDTGLFHVQQQPVQPVIVTLESGVARLQTAFMYLAMHIFQLTICRQVAVQVSSLATVIPLPQAAFVVIGE